MTGGYLEKKWVGIKIYRKAEYVQCRVRFVNVQLSFLFVRTRNKNFECGIAQPSLTV